MQKDNLENPSNEDILWNIKQDIPKEDWIIDLETLSTFLTDNDVKTEESKKFDEEKKLASNNKGIKDWLIFDININSINDILDLLLINQYDFCMCEPISDNIKVVFKKDQIVKDTKYIKFHVYSNILIQAKKISKLNLEETTIEQKWTWEYQYKNQNLEVLSKVIPSSFWEILYIKTKQLDKNLNDKKNKRKSISLSTAFWFLWAIFFIALIIWASFLTFIVFNAQTPSDVSFFSSLWINLNDINSFLLKMTTAIFSIVVMIESVILIIFLFKALLTKKELKRKKIIYFILSTIILIITFTTWTLWIKLDSLIKKLPNWQEMSYWDVQIYDNELLKSDKFDKKNALITDYINLIWPIELKFDLKYLQKDELRRWFEIKKYIWDFWDWDTVESQNPEVVQKFDKKWNFQIKLILEGIDKKNPNKITRKSSSSMPMISITNLVKITENTIANWWKTINFDASDLKPLWDIEWYFQDDSTKPAYMWEIFEPSKIYFNEDAIWMLIRRDWKQWNSMDRVFIISWEKTKISWDIKYEASIDNDLNYNFKLTNLENTPWAWFIKSFKRTFENREITKYADILNLESSSQVNFHFSNYWKQTVKVLITNTTWKSTQIQKEIEIPKRIKTLNNIHFYQDDLEINDVKYDEAIREYSLYNIWIPTRLKFDAKLIKSDNPLYYLDKVTWNSWTDWDINNEDNYFEKTFNVKWNQQIKVNYKFVHRKDQNEIINLTDTIFLELVEKEANINFEIKTDSEYVPVIASFDASLSKVKNDNIVKFIYDYWDWITEERDAINPWHRYLKDWTYQVKLTVVTQTWKEYSKVKTIVFKSPVYEWKISVSMNKAPVNQEIDFLSTWSVWQVTDYHWDFWDGETSNEANPSHAYKKPWKYKVILTLDFSNNNVITKETVVEIVE